MRLKAWFGSLVSGWAASGAAHERDLLQMSLEDANANIERLQHELVLRQYDVEAMERRVEMMAMAHEDNMKLLDHIAVTHGINSARS